LQKCRQGHSARSAAPNRFIIDIGEIHDALNLIASKFQMPLQQILEDVSAKIPNVSVIIHRRPARVHASAIRLNRPELLDLTRQRIKKAQAHFLSTEATANAAIPSPRPRK